MPTNEEVILIQDSPATSSATVPALLLATHLRCMRYPRP